MASVSPASPGTAGASRPSLSIRARLLVLAIVAAAPLVFDRVRLLESARIERISSAYDDAIGLARREVETQQETVIAARAVLQVITRTQTGLARAPDDCNRTLASISADVTWIKGLTLAGTNGRIICSTSPNATGLDLSDRSYFQQALATGDF